MNRTFLPPLTSSWPIAHSKVRLPPPRHAEGENVFRALDEAPLAQGGELALDGRGKPPELQRREGLLGRQVRLNAQTLDPADLTVVHLEFGELMQVLAEAPALLL